MNEERWDSSDKHHQIFSSVLSRGTYTYRLAFKIDLIAAEYMLPIFYATISDFERLLKGTYTLPQGDKVLFPLSLQCTYNVEGMYNPQKTCRMSA
jgi:hypothetical protein